MKRDLRVADVWDLVVDYGIATDEEVRLLFGINGYSIDTLNDLIYFRTGFRDIEQYEIYEVIMYER